MSNDLDWTPLIGRPPEPPETAKPVHHSRFRVTVLLAGPDLVWLREKQAEWGCSEGEALRRLVSTYRQVEQRGIEDAS